MPDIGELQQISQGSIHIASVAGGIIRPAQIQIANVGFPALKPYLLRPDAEKIKTHTYDALLVEDEEINIPAYTTTATTV